MRCSSAEGCRAALSSWKHATPVSTRPLSVTVIGYLFIIAGVVGAGYHAAELKADGPVEVGLIWVLFVRLLAILFGVFMLRGRNWARWLLLAWIAYHVVLSAFHTVSELAVHGLLLVAVAFFLLHPRASAYFRAASAEDAQMPED